MFKHAAIASLLASFMGSIAIVILASSSYGRAAIAFALVMLPVSFIVAFGPAIPVLVIFP